VAKGLADGCARGRDTMAKSNTVTLPGVHEDDMFTNARRYVLMTPEEEVATLPVAEKSKRVEQVAEMAKKGASQQAIADALGLKTHTIYCYIQEAVNNGILEEQEKPKRHQWTAADGLTLEEKKKRIADLANQGYTKAKAAAELGIKEDTLSQYSQQAQKEGIHPVEYYPKSLRPEERSPYENGFLEASGEPVPFEPPEEARETVTGGITDSTFARWRDAMAEAKTICERYHKLSVEATKAMEEPEDILTMMLDKMRLEISQRVKKAEG